MSVIPAPRPCSPSFKFCVGGACTKGDLLGENSIAFIDDYDRVDQLPEETLELYLTMYKRSLRTIERSSINFQTLRVIDVSHYRWLTYLFSIEMVRCLQCLEKISIRHCWSMLGLIDNSHKTDLLLSCSLPRLQELVLIDLPLLQSTCSEEVELKWPAFQSLIVWQCDKLTKLPRVVSQDGNAIQFDVRGRSSWVSSLVLLDGFHPSNFKEDNKEPEEITFDRVKEIEPMPTESPNDDRGAISETRAVERSGSRRSHSYTNVFDACFLGEIEPR